MKSKQQFTVFCILMLAGSFAAGFWTHAKIISHRGGPVRLGEGRYTNSLLECDSGAVGISSEKIDFAPQLSDLVNNYEKKSFIAKIAVYFRDLNNGPTFGANDEEHFFPASLLKVPLMMEYYKMREINPQAWDKPLTAEHLDTESVNDQNIKPSKTLEAGKSYAISELIERMITSSDNASASLLSRNLPLGSLSHLYELLGVDDIAANDPSEPLSAREYSSFFRILYNGSYLSIEDSEHALGLLAKSDFKDGIVAGVPSTIAVAHKFGERTIVESGQQQIHDCGIVYYPRHPYLLCIMTRGYSQNEQIKTIQGISAFVFKKIDAQYYDEGREGEKESHR